jgi:hypothetical protein
LQYVFTANLSADITYTANLARNAEDLQDIAKNSASYLPATKREFNDQIISVGLLFKL